jgi:hypothetical protein
MNNDIVLAFFLVIFMRLKLMQMNDEDCMCKVSCAVHCEWMRINTVFPPLFKLLCSWNFGSSAKLQEMVGHQGS